MHIFSWSMLAMLTLLSVAKADEPGDCFESRAPSDAITACSRLVQAGRFTDRQLAAVFNNRGNAFAAVDQLEQAVADYSMALVLEPD